MKKTINSTFSLKDSAVSQVLTDECAFLKISKRVVKISLVKAALFFPDFRFILSKK